MAHPLLPRYVEHLARYTNLQAALYQQLEPHLTLVPYQHPGGGKSFIPIRATLLEQIKANPDDLNLTPVLWVEPGEGTLTLNGMTWEFVFYPETLAFSNDLGHRVRIEFSNDGDICVTEHTCEVYFRTLPSQDDQTQALFENNSQLYEDAIAHGYLEPRPSMFHILDPCAVFIPRDIS